MSVMRTSVSGWGRFPVVDGELLRPSRIADLRRAVTANHGRSLLARGSGRSYGDAALNAGGQTVLTRRLNRMLDFDTRTGLLRCEAGVELAELLQVFVPRGWFPPVTPGTKFVTVGGALAFDIHGKNHHCDGTFSRSVRSFELMLASGETVSCSPEDNAELFWATVGGAGLTGILIDVTFALRPIESAYIDLQTYKARSLDDALQLFDAHESDYSYSVAWIDCLAGGGALGRSILMLGNHARRSDLDAERAADPLRHRSARLFSMPVDLPGGLLNGWTVRAFNALYYHRHLGRQRRSLTELDPFFYPLDAIGEWRRLYGKPGFVQYQCVFPPDRSHDGLVRMLTRLSKSRRASFLAVLKRFGPASPAPLSFPMPGYTLSLDIPVRPGLAEFVSGLDRVVLDHGGRVYLAKDALLSAPAFRTMYPRYAEWRQVKQRVDPDDRFASDLSRRLEITGRTTA